MIDRADMVKELIMIRDGVLSGSVDFTPEDVHCTDINNSFEC